MDFSVFSEIPLKKKKRKRKCDLDKWPCIKCRSVEIVHLLEHGQDRQVLK